MAPVQEPGGCAIRRSFLLFPEWSQPFWTLLTGKPLPGEKAKIRLHPVAMVVSTLVLLFTLIAVHASLIQQSGYAFLAGAALTPVFSLLVTGAMRKIQVVYVHHAVHDALVPRSPKANQWMGDLLTTLVLVQNTHEYRREHFAHHSRGVFTTLQDADAALLYRFGLRPGRPVDVLRNVLLTTLFSPTYHLYFLGARLKSNVVARPWPWRIVAITWIGALLFAVPYALGTTVAVLAVWLPMIVIYQMSALLQFLTEHLWLLTPNAPSEPEAYSERCVGRFCGEMVPQGLEEWAWMKWWLRTLLIHVPVRLGVLVGDLPAHDWHHICGHTRHPPPNWSSAIYARQMAIDSGMSMGMERRELWGLPQMLDRVFTAMSRAPEIEVTPEGLPNHASRHISS